MKTESKTDRAEQLFSRPEGATMDEVVAATGDYQYNVLRRLEARGYLVRKKREGRMTRYWVSPPAARAFDLSIASNGQTTLPKEVRRQFGVTAGGHVKLVLESPNRATLAPASISLNDLRGLLPKPKRPATLDEMEEGIARGATKS
jgi:bifunctional DNA-binding transcriptional regulator/antitoxin component of YhaV-PrlF toxin-antitoxin module